MPGITLIPQIRDNMTGYLVRTEEALRGESARRVFGASATLTIQDWLLKLNKERSRSRRSQFYARASEATNYRLTTNGVTVSITQQGIAQRFFGGWIFPVNSDWLTIPARDEAYGRRAREFSNLTFIILAQGGAALISFEPVAKKKKGELRAGTSHDTGTVFFWLKKSVYQNPDPTVLPPDDKITDPALQAVAKYLENL